MASSLLPCLSGFHASGAFKPPAGSPPGKGTRVSQEMRAQLVAPVHASVVRTPSHLDFAHLDFAHLDFAHLDFAHLDFAHLDFAHLDFRADFKAAT
jgi:hypothetical protein